MDKESNFCTESRPVRFGDFIYLFSDGYGNVNCSSVEISDGDTTVTFEDFPELSEEISDYDNCIVTHAYLEDGCLYIYVKEL